MFKKLTFYLLTLLVLSCSTLPDGEQQHVRYEIDLRSVKDDQLLVTLFPPTFTQQDVLFRFPSVIPGTYSIYDFGRFVTDVTAYNSDGKKIPVEQLDVNTYKISSLNKLKKITYVVDDTWDDQRENSVFEPAGTSFEEDQFFLLNHQTLFGYFEGFTQLPIQLSISKPEYFYGSTSLMNKSSSQTLDQFTTSTYHELIDSPIMYNRPDTVTFSVGNTNVLVSVYSPAQILSSNQVAENIKDLLFATRDFLGGNLPINKYAFLITLSDQIGYGSAYGALEHSNSSVYYLPEGDSFELSQTIRDVAAHEFYHIITPLNIHSEEISYFNFNQPKMSQHLWLYEGVTEYMAGYIQLRQGLISIEEYWNVIRGKMNMASRRFNDELPFTELSKFCLDKHKSQYQNVYEKGALIGLHLDIRIRHYSQGRMGLQDVMNQLMTIYGKNKPFKDNQLFDEITKLTHPKIRDFFALYVEGPNPLPHEETMAMIGYDYFPIATSKEFSLGEFDPNVDLDTRLLFVDNIENMNEFGKAMGYQIGDTLLSINGNELSLESFFNIFFNWIQTVQEGDDLTVTVKRGNQVINLTQKVVKSEVREVHVLRAQTQMTVPALTIFESWSGK